MPDFDQPVIERQEVDIIGYDDSTVGVVNALSSASKSNIRLTAATVLNGIANGSNGKNLFISNATGAPIVINNESVLASANNRILTGLGASITIGIDGSVLLIYDATTLRWRIAGDGVQGPQGSQGAQGFQGAQGLQGATGLQGPTGAQGLQGSVGAQGNQGFQGDTGATGAQGFQGFQGLQGLQGAQGLQGSQGFQGNQGSQGFQGFQGTAGSTTVDHGVVSINATAANTTITTGTTLWYPNINIQAAHTYTINSGATLRTIGTVIVSGVLIANGNVIITN